MVHCNISLSYIIVQQFLYTQNQTNKQNTVIVTS